MIGRAPVASLLTALLAVVAASAGAQHARTLEIAILTPAFGPWHPLTEGFRDGLEELGPVGGRTVRFEVRAAKGEATRLPALARELSGRGPALLYCVGTAAAEECVRTAPDVPLVFVEVPDPVRVGLVKSLASPGPKIKAVKRHELTVVEAPTRR